MRLTYRPFAQANAKLRQKSLLRRLPKDKKFRHDFSHNDYLGLSQHPSMLQVMQNFCPSSGVGNRGSRLISLKQNQIQTLEQDIARSKHTKAALVFATGFQANASVLSALLDKKLYGKIPLVFSDKLNHASIHVGCQIANVKQLRYQHLDTEHLHFLLKKYPIEYPKLIITESVFGMDGDIAPLAKLLQLAKDYNALLYVDEAHATGLFGANGYGCTEDFCGEIDITMGTFSKALGSSGAYLACHPVIKRYLINRCQGLIYSTAPSPINIALMQTAWDLIPTLRKQVAALFERALQFRSFCKQIGFDIGTSTTHIIPIIFKDTKKTLLAQQFLNQHQIHVGAIRPPSVGPMQSRLRIALSLEHDLQAIEALKRALENLAARN